MIRLITVVLNFPTVIAVFIVYAKAIYVAMFENPYFTASTAKVTKLNNDIAALDAAETGCKTSPPTKLRLCGFAIRAFKSWIYNPIYIRQIQY